MWTATCWRTSVKDEVQTHDVLLDFFFPFGRFFGKYFNHTWFVACFACSTSSQSNSLVILNCVLKFLSKTDVLNACDSIILNRCGDWPAGGWRWVLLTWPVRSIGWFICGCCRRPSGLEEVCRLNPDPNAASSRKTRAESRLCSALWNYCQVRRHIIYTVSHRSEYTPHVFVNILLYLFNTEEMTLCYNVK